MEEKELKSFSQKYADKAGYKLNPDEKIVSMILKGLLKMEAKHGYRFCPCRMVSGDMQKDRLNICPCAFHKDEINKDGKCKCQLFVRN